MTLHKPVMVSEVVRLLSFEGEGWIVDGTLGLAGHSAALLAACPKARLLGLDRDPETIADAEANLEPFKGRFETVVSDYADMGLRMKERGISGALAIIIDLGWSSRQIADPTRGFSFMNPGPVDMRFDRTKGQPLSELLEEWDEAELKRIIKEYGEENWASRIASRIKTALKTRPFRDTVELSETIASAVPRKAWPKNIHVATRSFQAFRIAVNDEL